MYSALLILFILLLYFKSTHHRFQSHLTLPPQPLPNWKPLYPEGGISFTSMYSTLLILFIYPASYRCCVLHQQTTDSTQLHPSPSLNSLSIKNHSILKEVFFPCLHLASALNILLHTVDVFYINTPSAFPYFPLC